MDEQQKPEIELDYFSRSQSRFDEKSIPEELYANDPEQARAKIQEGLQKEQQALEKRLTDQGIHKGYLENIRRVQEEYATEAMRADLLIAKHPEFSDVASIAFDSIFNKFARKAAEIKLEAKKSVYSRYKNSSIMDIISGDLDIYQVSIELSTAVKLARPQDLKTAVTSETIFFPNLMNYYEQSIKATLGQPPVPQPVR